MMMKLLSYSALATVAFVGTACSQQAEPAAQTETSTPAATEVSTTSEDPFNLGLPGQDLGTGASSDGFNLAPPPNTAGTSSDGFNLPTTLPSEEDSLARLPDIDTSLLETATEPAQEQSEEEEEDDLIRIE